MTKRSELRTNKKGKRSVSASELSGLVLAIIVFSFVESLRGGGSMTPARE